jgi:hypothetical protein
MNQFEAGHGTVPAGGNPFLGILVGLAMAIGVWLVTVVLAMTFQLFPLAVALCFFCPPLAPAVAGWRARDERPRYAVGLFISAAVVTLLEGSCAATLFRG